MVKKADCTSKYISVYLDSTHLASPKYTITQPSCGTKGSITITTTADFYSIDGQTWITSPTFSNLSSGYYYPYIKNAQGCISNSSFANIQTFYLPSPTFTSIQPTCGNGGSITFTATAAQYSIDGGNTWNTNPVFTNLNSGSYYLVLKNAAGCTSYLYDTYANLNPYYLPNPDFTFIQPTCGTNGSTTIATVADSYSFDGGTTWTTNPTLSGLTSGYYNIVIKNATGCKSYGISIYINPFYLPNPNVKVIQPSCENGGSITVTTPVDQYSFDGGITWSTNPILLNPTSSSYTIVVKNTAGCKSQPQYYYINKYYLPTPNVTSIQPTCSSPSGTIIINTTADQYSFDNGVTWTTNPIKKNLAGGSYTTVIKNTLGCVSYGSYTYIDTPPTIPLAPAVQIVQPSSCGATDGSITITTTAQSYSFNDGNSWTTNPTKINVGAGTYIIKIKTYSYSCESSTTVVNLSSGTTIAAPAYTSTQPNCSSAKGSITIATTAATYSYDNGLTYVFSNTKTDLSPGIYFIKIKNLAGCVSDAATVTISTLSALPAPAYKASQPDCTNFTGSLSIDTVADLYSFDNGITFGTSNTKSNVAPGTYNLMIKYNSGCISLSAPVTIDAAPTIPAAPQVVVTNPIGCTSSTGSIMVSTVANLYSFDDGLTWNTTNTASLSPGNYLIRIKYTNGCPSIAYAATINTPPNAPSTPILNVSQPVSCSNPFGSISITSAAYQYSFDNGANYSTNPISGNLVAGTYLVRVKNSSGCESVALSVKINPPTDYPVNPSFITIQPDCNNLKGTIIITDIAAEYSFDNGVTWKTNTMQSNLDPGTYYLKAKNSIGCISNATTATLIPFTNFTPKPTLTNPQIFCIQQNPTLSEISITGQNIKWYDNLTNGTPLSNTAPLQNGTTYHASQTINGCESARIPVLINIQNTPTPTENTNQMLCSSQNPTLDTIQISGTSIKWYNSSGTLLINSTSLQNGMTYYATQTVNNCESERLGITISIVNTPATPTAITTQSFCKKENARLSTIQIAGQDIKWYETNFSAISLPNSTLLENKKSYYASQTIGCESDRIAVLIRIYDTPPPTGNTNQQFCFDENAQISNLNILGSNMKWYDALTNGTVLAEITVLTNGVTYYATQTLNDCESERIAITVTIQDTQSPIGNPNQSFCIQENGKISTISIEGQNIKWYTSLSSLTTLSESIVLENGMTYYASQTINNCESERTQITVKILEATNAGCLDLVYELPYPKFLTPNGDGFNDYWTINFAYLKPNTGIKIFDRYGKLLTVLNQNETWNGTYNNQQLPATDYWFVVTRADGNEYKGHFSLKR